jgi:Bacterial Ig-like domain
MRALKQSVLVLLFASLAGCGQQLVQFPLADGGTTGGGGSDAGLTAPTVTSTNPGSGLVGLCIPAQINATFSTAMEPLTIDGASFTLTSPGPTSVAGAVTYDAATQVASFAPASVLVGSTTYTATITTGATDQAGTALASNKVWTFTTSSLPCVRPVNLRSLSSFVAVAGAGLTNSNTQLPAVTTLNGDVGLSPTATCMSSENHRQPVRE